MGGPFYVVESENVFIISRSLMPLHQRWAEGEEEKVAQGLHQEHLKPFLGPGQEYKTSTYSITRISVFLAVVEAD